MEPLTLGALSAVALTEGIKFLYDQAGDALRRWWARGSEAQDQPAPSQVVEVPPIVAGGLASLVLREHAMETLAQDIERLRSGLSLYAEGIKSVDSEDVRVLSIADGLRRALETVYEQRITFVGEDRPTSGASLRGEAHADVVAGELAGVRVDSLEGVSSIEGHAEAGRVEEGGLAAGVSLKRKN